MRGDLAVGPFLGAADMTDKKVWLEESGGGFRASAEIAGRTVSEYGKSPLVAVLRLAGRLVEIAETGGK
ncbi:hypothetical protein LCGC14_0979540 [marine sediment metagenome]|uniref:Uncharacterized protein n=2 Tax=marine sediment metagenome TaxID=412755 RepID=A0A0F9N949_9ZZZZ